MGIIANRLAEYFVRAGFVVMKKTPAGGASGLARIFEGLVLLFASSRPVGCRPRRVSATGIAVPRRCGSALSAWFSQAARLQIWCTRCTKLGTRARAAI